MSHMSGDCQRPKSSHIQNALGPSHVDGRKQRSDHQRHARDQFCHARNGHLPAGARHAQDGREQRPGVADADEENKTGDVEPPRNAIAHIGDNEPVLELQAVSVQRPAEHCQQERDPRKVTETRPPQRREHVLFEARPPGGKIIVLSPGQFIHRLWASMRLYFRRSVHKFFSYHPGMNRISARNRLCDLDATKITSGPV